MLKSYNLFTKHLKQIVENNEFLPIPGGTTDEDKKEAWSKFAYSYVALGNKFPFFYDMLVKMQVLMTDEVETMATDGVYVLFNPSFVLNELTVPEVIFVIAHEIMHVVTFTFSRMGSRNPHGWNMATDYAINLMLGDDIGKRPKNILYDTKYLDMAAEAIYDELAENQNMDDNSENDDGGDGEGKKPAQVGDYILVNHNKKFGRITKINDDGSYEYEEVDRSEVDNALK